MKIFEKKVEIKTIYRCSIFQTKFTKISVKTKINQMFSKKSTQITSYFIEKNEIFDKIDKEKKDNYR